ncbi:hypothetical protein [Allosphingosinicella deserti]|uniref:Uncharacterized protein n=1 Tax=Allosphingosinicella deserti TaxID=2116704 RepID=A0A2P7QLM9_9SPHN|nr:hypothetical protein [Sphingomonas deserti]PSJ38871.1 hypothetical protein C7I55_16235 [Sphingomonas deserti]
MADKFTRRADASGWLSVRLTRSNTLASLCEYTRVTKLRQSGGRTYFTIADGFVSVGEEASLADANAARYLSDTGPGGAAALVVQYNGKAEETSPFQGRRVQQWATLSFGMQTARVTLNSIWNSSYQPITPGKHTILGPDYSHKNISTEGYVQATPGMVGNDVWFPIGLMGSTANSSRYIHVGHLSEGCVTVHQLERWTALYQYLISRRVPGSSGKRIGTIEVRK